MRLPPNALTASRLVLLLPVMGLLATAQGATSYSVMVSLIDASRDNSPGISRRAHSDRDDLAKNRLANLLCLLLHH